MTSSDEDFEFDADALAMIAAYRHDEQMPEPLEAAVWERLEPEVTESAAGFPRWGFVVLAAAAAAVVIVLGAKSFAPDEFAPDARGEMAPYQRPAQETAGVVEEGRTTRTRAPSNATSSPVVSPSQSTSAQPAALDEPVTELPPRNKKSGNNRASQTALEVEVGEEPSATTLAEETRLLRAAQTAMKAGSPREALALLTSCEQKFPNGVLIEERRALEVIALCSAGDVKQGRAAASVFLSKRPRSALAPRVRDACRDAE